MAVVNIRNKRSFHWIPPATTPIWKFTVESSDGTVKDITDFVTYLEIEDNVTENIGRFNFKLFNPDDEYTNLWTGNEIVRYYKNYGTEATTLKFRGRIEKPSKKGNRLEVDGRSESLSFIETNVTKQYSNIETSLILKDLLTIYQPTITTNNVNISDKLLTIDFYETPLLDAIKSLAIAAGFDFYLDGNNDMHYFLVGSDKNTTDAIVHDINMLDVEDFAPDLTQVSNKIKVYGATVDGIQCIYTAEDLTSQSAYGIREEIITDNSIINQTQAKEVAEYELERKKDPPIVGAIKGFLLGDITPGQKLRISSPSDDIPPLYDGYNTTGYVDIIDLDNTEFSTKVYVNKQPRTISNVLKNRIEQENKNKETNINPYGMEYTRNFYFNDELDTQTHTNTEITDGVLKLEDGQSSGSWLSTSLSLTSNLTNIYLLIVGQSLTGATVEVSGNGGASFESIDNLNTKTISSAIGSSLVIKVTINNTETQIDSLSIQYKIE